MFIPSEPDFIKALRSQNSPIDLWNTFGPPSLPKNVLPDVIDKFAHDVADQMGSDPAGLAMSALTIASGAIPDYIQLQMKAHDVKWVEHPRLWTLLIGLPSTKKSPILRAASGQLAQIDSSWAFQGNASHAAWSALSKEERKLTPEPKIKRLRIEDTTIEAAQEVLKDNHNGIICIRDEASGWFGQMEKYNSAKSASTDRSFWLRAYDGGTYNVDRVGRGKSQIKNLSISFLGGIQPGPLAELAASASDDGLLQRMMPVILKSSEEGKDEATTGSQAYFDFVILILTQLPPMQTLRFDAEAQKLRSIYEKRFHHLMKAEAINPKLASHIGKLDGLFGRLCIVWHTLENHMNMTPVISFQTAQRVGWFIEEFLLPQIACYYDLMGLSDDQSTIKAVAEHILAKNLPQVTSRIIYKSTQSLRKLTKKDILPVFQQLIALGWLSEAPNRQGTNDPIYNVNMEVHTLFKDKAEKERKRREEVQEIMAYNFGR